MKTLRRLLVCFAVFAAVTAGGAYVFRQELWDAARDLAMEEPAFDAPGVSRIINVDLDNREQGAGREAPWGLPGEYRFSQGALKRYRGQIQTVARESAESEAPGIVIDKSEHSLLVYQEGQVAARFPIELGSNPVDDKIMEGDRCTPEGLYRVSQVKQQGQTQFYRALLLDYPNKDDRARFERLEAQGLLPYGATLGGLIEIHGKGSGLGPMGVDWTLGCIALSNDDMDALMALGTRPGTPVAIVRYGTAK